MVGPVESSIGGSTPRSVWVFFQALCCLPFCSRVRLRGSISLVLGPIFPFLVRARLFRDRFYLVCIIIVLSGFLLRWGFVGHLFCGRLYSFVFRFVHGHLGVTFVGCAASVRAARPRVLFYSESGGCTACIRLL